MQPTKKIKPIKKTKLLFVVTLFTILAIFVMSSTSWATTYYVDATKGNDSYTGTSESAPWKTIAKVNSSQFQPGDFILLKRGGVWKEQLTIPSSGSSENPITFSAYGTGNNPVIDGNNNTMPVSRHDGLIFIYHRQYIVIENINVTYSNSYGIVAKGNNTEIIIRNSKVSYSNDGGIVFESYGGNSSNVLIEYCDVHHSNYRGEDSSHEAITLGGADGFTVRNCEVHDNRIKEGIDAKSGSINGFIYDNNVYHNYDVGIYLDGAQDVRVYRNKVYNQDGNDTGHGIMVATESFNDDNAKNNYIYNNLIYDNSGAGINIYGEDGKFIEDCSIINNTIVNNAKAGVWFMSNDIHKGNIFRNNIFWNNGLDEGKKDFRTEQSSNLWDNQIIDHNLFNSNTGTQRYGSDYLVTSDVKFIDESNQDFQLKGDSPAIDTGVSTNVTNRDFNGNIRPSGNRYDIGAYEFPMSVLTILNPPQNSKIISQ